jgi:hypothetical protein
VSHPSARRERETPLQVAHDSPAGDSRLGSTNAGVRLIVDRKTLDRLTTLRGPGHSDVILRPAKG